jgi:DmsE family decaheme c-type cytochrome
MSWWGVGPKLRDDPGQSRIRSRTASIAIAAASAAIMACVSAWHPEPQSYHRTTADLVDAEPWGAEDCVDCHEEVYGHAPIATYHEDCEACHGLGSLHAESEEPQDIRFPASADCLACHEKGRDTHLDWATGGHERAGLICSDCHNPHEREPNLVRRAGDITFGYLDPNSSLCVQCHLDVASRLTFPSHHPVREGMLSCTDCHEPHGDTRTALGDRVSLCAECHQDYAGPWIFEHAPAAEDCTMCHNPHGTASYNLLDTSMPALCISCHSTADPWHFRATGEPGLRTISTDFPEPPLDPTVPSEVITTLGAGAFYTRCTDCHGAIHGSYQDRHLRR